LRGHQVAAAEDAAHGDGKNKVRIRGTVAVGTDFCGHAKWLRASESSTIFLECNAHFQQGAI
jgi:hypothetical protein